MYRTRAIFFAILGIVVFVIIAFINWNASRLDETTAAITQIVQVTQTEIPEPSPTPTVVATPTAAFSGTPAPPFRGPGLASADCNPYWENSYEVNLSLVDSKKEARELLYTELQRWTRENSIQGDSIYLTYLSPQVIEAIVVYNAVHQGMSSQESQNLLIDIERRLQLNNSMAFLILVKHTSAKIGRVQFYPLEQSLMLYDQRKEKFAPYEEYTQRLIEPISVRGNTVQGYILFPKSAVEECYPTIDLLYDHSFDVRLNSVQVVSRILDTVSIDHYEGPYLFSYNLLPNIPLEQAMNIPVSTEAPELDIEMLNDILSLALTIIELLQTLG